MTQTNEEASATKIGIFNLKGLKKRLRTVDQLSKEMMVLGLCETWARGDSDPITKTIDESAPAPPTIRLNRGYGGVGLIVHPLLKYHLKDKFSSPTIQSITVKLTALTISIIYISPRAPAKDVATALDRLHRISGTRAIIMGDMNGRHTDWDTKSNARGLNLTRWSVRNGWKIYGPDEPTYRSPKGNSSPDIFMLRGLTHATVSTRTKMTDTGSDHLPVELSVKLHSKEVNNQRTAHIPRRQRRNAKTLQDARVQYNSKLPSCLEKIEKASDGRELEEAYEGYKETILGPWEKHRRKKPNRYKPWWNDTLDSLAKHRRRLYRRALTTGDKRAEQAYKAVDKQIKHKVRENKKAQQDRLKKRLEGGIQATALPALRQLWRTNRTHDQTDDTTLDASEFTRHMSTPPDQRWAPTVTPVEINDSTKRAIEYAIKGAPCSKATGVDEIFAEALQVDIKHNTKIIGALWKKCTELNHVLKDWATALLIPIYKKGDKSKPDSYRPIALLSHVRKIVESAIAKIIRKNYKFHECQLGFREGTGAETAIIRHIQSAQRMEVTAVLDLKAAYDSVPRDQLYKVAQKSQRGEVMSMIGFALQPVRTITQGDSSGKVGTIAKGVCQGSPLSPTLFNMYVDTMPKWIQDSVEPPTNATNRGEREWQMTLFADDVKLQAKDERLMQRLLTAATKWAHRYEMTWSAGKCTIVRKNEQTEADTLEIGGQSIKNSTRAEYLGITATASGTAEDSTVERIKKAKKIAASLKQAGIHYGKATTDTLLRIWDMFVIPKATYGIHLVPLTEEIVKEWESLERLWMISTMGCYSGRTRNRLRTIGRIPTVSQVREMRMTALQQRITLRATTDQSEAAKTDRQGAIIAKALLKIKRRLDNKKLREAWEQEETRRKRKLPKMTMQKWPPALNIPNHTIRRAAIQWYCGTFPIPDTNRPQGGQALWRQTAGKLDRLMTKPKWNRNEQKEAAEMLRQLKE